MRSVLIRYSATILVLVIMSGIGEGLIAQDFHLSQYNSSPQNLNPAQTGLFNGDWRFVGNYRNQWKAIPVPYNTFSFSTDTRMNFSEKLSEKTFFRNANPTAGLLINSDRAGNSKLQTTQVYLSLGYIKKLNTPLSQSLSFGVQPGISNKTFKEDDLTFDNQFDGHTYDENLATGETFVNNSFTHFDLGAGVAYYIEKTNRKNLNIGISTFHLTTPQQSFFANNNTKLDIKYNFSAIGQYQILPRVDLLPTFLLQNQGKDGEFVYGLFGKYHLRPIEGMTTAISLGAFVRAKDAFIIAANMDYRNLNVGISYDINTSAFAEATNNRGAFEVSVIYILQKDVPFDVKKRFCPIFM